MFQGVEAERKGYFLLWHAYNHSVAVDGFSQRGEGRERGEFQLRGRSHADRGQDEIFHR